jgi:Fe2+ or Zn2+ uptake regulation protein
MRGIDTDPVEAILDQMRRRGGRATLSRRATITALLSGRRHLSAEDIVKEVKTSHPDVAESTIYRNLIALEELGVVNHVHLGHGPSTYHLAEESHQHLVCRRCGKVIEVPDEEFVPLAERLSSAYGFQIQPRHFAISGECRRCRTRTSGTRPPRPAA